MTNTIYKSIAYAYGSSQRAKDLGFYQTGCFFIQQRSKNEAGQWNTYATHNAEGFSNPADNDLISMFLETDGIIEPDFTIYGNQEALKAIHAMEKSNA